MGKRVTVFLAGAVFGAVLAYPFGVAHAMRSSGMVTAFGNKISAYKSDFDQSKRLVQDLGREYIAMTPGLQSNKTLQRVGVVDSQNTARADPQRIQQLEYGMSLAQSEACLGLAGAAVADLRQADVPVLVMMWQVGASQGIVLTYHNDRLFELRTISLE